MKVADHYPSTKGLSVYNALSVSGRDLTEEEIGEYLRETFDENVDAAYVATGVQFLLERGFAVRVHGLVVIPRYGAHRLGRELKRTKHDTDLVYGRA